MLKPQLSLSPSLKPYFPRTVANTGCSHSTLGQPPSQCFSKYAVFFMRVLYFNRTPSRNVLGTFVVSTIVIVGLPSSSPTRGMTCSQLLHILLSTKTSSDRPASVPPFSFAALNSTFDSA